ncbi:AAA family ATPase [uncultured Fusobacterium sp.]|uniref:AAA family ATPase n=1 Tax=uncultured Fusobacterium sp. TaxID=159267 RepID=UPI0027DCA3A9|nr:AAA family ATPase [uncultured Fusobacterium sp.]
MIIKKVAIGNNEEAFIQPFFSDEFNIISSDDNNRGKTIIIQSMMYALGNEPVFPTSFNYKNYYYYVEFEEQGKTYYLCRYNKNFLIKNSSNNSILFFNNTSEFKKYWSKNIFSLPKIIKDSSLKTVDPELFLQLFFIGQDKRDTSNISNSGYYNKNDFMNMVFNFCGISEIELTEDEVKNIKDLISKLTNEKEELSKKYKILNSKKKSISYLSSVCDKKYFAQKISKLEEKKEQISELKKERSTTFLLKTKWGNTIKELRSLNRTIESGKLCCMDCHSTNISFKVGKDNSFVFDVSTKEMRDEIINSIKEKIEMYEEEIKKIDISIEKFQNQLVELLKDDDISLESIVLFKDEIFNISDANKKIDEVNKKIDDLKSKLLLNKSSQNSNLEQQQQINQKIVKKMNDTYKKIDPDGNLNFEGLFTKRTEVFSGSEAAIFHLVKLFALQNVLKHHFPIIVDSFRAEDLSTKKESVVLEIYKMIPNQKIFTTTLKKEELGKYDNLPEIFHIDYKDHKPSKILSSSYVENFKLLISLFPIQLDA